MERTSLVILLVALTACREEEPFGEGTAPSFGTPVAIVPAGVLKSPRGISTPRTGEIWVSDTENDRIAVFTMQGSQLLSLPLSPKPGPMGLDRATGNVLVVAGGTTLFSVNISTQQISPLLALTPGMISSGGVYDVTTGAVRPRVLTLIQGGDPDGSPGGDIYLSCLANVRENYLVRLRAGTATALAYSSYPPLDSLNRFPRFVGASLPGSVYTAFVLPDNSLFGFVEPYVFVPDSPVRSRPVPGGEEAGAYFPAGGMSEEGLLVVADAEARTVLVFSTAPEALLAVLTMPAIAGITQAAATDAAFGRDGSVVASVRDLQDPANERGAVIRYPRNDGE